MVQDLLFRRFAADDLDACLALFDANCPEFFAPNERAEYAGFLRTNPAAYEICEAAGKVVGAYGLFGDDGRDKILHWIMIDPQLHGTGIGTGIMDRVMRECRDGGSARLRIAASHRSAPFFARFGATEVERRKDGWGAGMDRVDMLLQADAYFART